MSPSHEDAKPGAAAAKSPPPERARAPLEIDVLTLFPAMLEGPLAESIPGRVQSRGLAAIRVHDLRQWGLGRHKTVDDYTYGGGAGMVLRPEPVAGALGALRRPDSTVILPDPGGEVFGQARAHDLATRSHLIILCPRYEGVDERIRSMVDLELSIGDYVLSGGEIPALVIVDSILRLLPGAIDAESIAEESFTAGLLEYPQYTRPPVFREMAVPDVLTSGHHEAVRVWRLKEALHRTLRRRPELLDRRAMAREEAMLLAEVRDEEAAAEETDAGAAAETEAAAEETDAGAAAETDAGAAEEARADAVVGPPGD
jgi:tRNA (guanine37-N1)-methyltransferase